MNLGAFDKVKLEPLMSQTSDKSGAFDVAIVQPENLDASDRDFGAFDQVKVEPEKFDADEEGYGEFDEVKVEPEKLNDKEVGFGAFYEVKLQSENKLFSSRNSFKALKEVN